MNAALMGGGAAAVAPIAPSSVTGLLCWHDFSIIGSLFTDAAMTIPVTADGDVIGAVVDQSVNARTATQSTTSSKPKYKVNIQNGLSAALADANDRLSTASITHSIGTGDFLLMGVIKTITIAGGYQAYCGIGAVDPGFYAGTPGSSAGFYWGGDYAFNAILSNATAYLLEFWRDAGVIKFAINGIQDPTTHSVSTSLANGIFRLAESGDGGEGLAGYMLEWTFYKGYPSTSVVGLRKYFNNKWVIY